MKNGFTGGGWRPCLTIVKGQGVHLIFHHDAGSRQVKGILGHGLQPCAATVLRLLHDTLRRVQPLQSMIADEMGSNALHTGSEVRQGTSGNDRGRRDLGQTLQGFTRRFGQTCGMPILNDARQRAVEIKGKKRAALAGQPVEHTFALSTEHVLHRRDYRPRPEACPTCFMTRMRRRILAASMSMRPAHR